MKWILNNGAMDNTQLRCVVGIVFLFAVVAINAQKKNETIVLNLDTLYSIKSGVGPIYHPATVKKWAHTGDDSFLDSVLYEYKGGDCCLQILVKNEAEDIKYCLLKRYNPFLNREQIISYSKDSVNKWNIGNVPDGAIPKIIIDFPHSTEIEPVEFYFIPYFSGMTYNDRRVQSLQLSISASTIRRVNYKDYTIYFCKDRYYRSDSNTAFLKVKNKQDSTYKNAYMDGITYKERYGLGDTIYISNANYRFDSISRSWEYAYFSVVSCITQQKIHLPDSVFTQIKQCFSGNRPYLLIDFWGTWCNPCIKGLPELRILYNSVHSQYNFVSVCFDRPTQFDRAKHIFKENKIEWSQIFDNQMNGSHSITNKLKISTFPSYLIINRDGEIVFKHEGAEGFVELRKYIYATFDSKLIDK